MRKKKTWPFYIPLLVLLPLAFYLSQRSSPPGQIPQEVAKPLRKGPEVHTPHPGARTTSVVPEKRKSGNCFNQMLKKIAHGCTKLCISQYVQKFDPDLAQFLTEEASPGDAKAYLKKKRSLLTTFYLARFGDEMRPEDQYQALKELSARDSENAYPALFFAAKAIELDKREEARAIVREAVQRKSYTNYSMDLRRRLFSLTIHDPQLFAGAVLVSEKIDTYNFMDLEGLRAFGPELGLQIGRKIAEPALREKEKGTQLSWDPAEIMLASDFVSESHPEEGRILQEMVERIYMEYYDPNVNMVSEKCREKDVEDFRFKEKERLGLLGQ